MYSHLFHRIAFSHYSGFGRKARVRKCSRFPRQKGGYGPKRSMHRPRKLRTRNATLLACDGIQLVLASIALNTFTWHTKMSIFSRKGLSSNYILQSQPGKLMLETFSWDITTEPIACGFCCYCGPKRGPQP